MQDANWVIEETKTAHFGDKRLNKRYEKLVDCLSNHPPKSIPSSFKNWKETIAAYRFFNHKNITSEKILAPHREATLGRIRNEKIVLIPQDTTDIDFSGREPISGMGYLGSEYSQGFYLHPSLAMTPDRTCLGIVNIHTWARDNLNSGGSRKKKPIEEKETYRWIKGYEVANDIALASPDTLIVSIADREGDIYDLLQKLPSESNKAYWLIRSWHNREVLNETDKNLSLRLKEAVRASKPIGNIEFKMPPGRIHTRDAWTRRARKARVVRQEIRACTVYIRPPANKSKKLPSFPINVVHCREINAPSEEEIIEWFLLTSLPINTAKTAIEVVKWYLCRWQIEVFFKILKTGCAVEELQFNTLKATTNCISIYLIVAWRILYLTMLGRNCPDMDCSTVFEDSEWQSVYAIVTKKSPPQTPPKLNEIIKMIAKLGGFLGRKSDKYPGAKVMWIGMQRMKDFSLAWETFHLTREKTYV